MSELLRTAILLSIAWIAPGQALAADAVAATGIATACLLAAIAAAALFVREHMRLARLRVQARALAHGEAVSDAPADNARDELAPVQAYIQSLHEQLRVQSERRERAEGALRESDQRYALAVRGANDGLWEWNIRSGAMYLSPRWYGMLGLSEGDLHESMDAWKSRIHPDDLVRVESALSRHLDGFTPRFESEHRLLHKNGQSRWVLSRGSAIRHANGTAYRVIGLDTDISQFKRIEATMMLLAEGTSGKTGEAFFRAMVKNFATVLGVRAAFMTRCLDYPTTRVRTLAFFDRDSFRDDLEFDLSGTPCEAVIRDGASCFHPQRLAELFPRERGWESYYGLPITDDEGRVIGHMAFFDDKPMDDGMLLDSIYRIFLARAAAELARQDVEHAIRELVSGLALASGDDNLRTLVRSFANVLCAREAFVTECSEDGDMQVHVLAWWRDGDFESERRYALTGSICEETVREGRLCFYPQGVSERFPRAKPLEREAYVGVPCKDARGRVIGHIACCHNRPMLRDLPDSAILQLFAERASVELERRLLLRRQTASDTRVGLAH